MRTLLISDIHGCFDELMKLLKNVNYQAGVDRLIVLGDLVDRGPKPIEVLYFFMQNLGQTPNFELVYGNHDLGVIDDLNFLAKYNRNFGLRSSTIGKIVAQGQDFVTGLLEMYKQAVPYIQIGNTILVHGGMQGGVDLQHQDLNIMVWMWPEDDGFNAFSNYDFIVGHNPTSTINGTDTICRERNTLFIDCGCVYGGNLCCYCLEEDTAYYVRGKDYRKVHG